MPMRIARDSRRHGTGRPRPARLRPPGSAPAAARNARCGRLRAATRWSASTRRGRAGLYSNLLSARRRAGRRVNGPRQLVPLFQERDEAGVDLDLIEQALGGATAVRAQLVAEVGVVRKRTERARKAPDVSRCYNEARFLLPH